MPITLTREEFQATIEQCIDAAGDDRPRGFSVRMRKIGRTATRLIRGGFRQDGLCCPVILAGYTSTSCDPAAMRFAFAFDDFTHAHARAARSDVIEVVDTDAESV
jgi:hypothetical protein